MNSKRCKRLSVVFNTSAELGEKYSVGTAILEPYMHSRGLDGVSALRMVIDKMQQLGMSMEFKENGKGKLIPAELYLKQMEKQGAWNRPLVTGGLSFNFGSVPSLQYCFISIEELNFGCAICWFDWVESFMEVDGFTQAWVSDVEYEYWQNVESTLEYEAAGRDYAHMVLKSNGLPPPLEQIEIDTSNNPGRIVPHLGYIESIGSIMWLNCNLSFFLNEDKIDTLHSTDWLDIKLLKNNVIQIGLFENTFCDETTKGMQDRLRTILYT